MACKLLVSYRSGRPRGDIVVVVPDSHEWGRYESLAKWVEMGGTPETWPRSFTVINVTDKDVEDVVHYSEKSMETGQGLYTVGVPPIDTEEYTSLRDTGEFTCTWDKVDFYLEER